jgi:hypothetical protein
MKLLSINADAKTSKGNAKGYLTGIQYLAPLGIAKRGTVCPMASKGCAKACLYTAGRGAFTATQAARIARTQYWADSPEQHAAQLREEVASLVRKALRQGMAPAVRLNGTSDIPWENTGAESVIRENKETHFYDYTKNFGRMLAYLENRFPSNYSLTFSRSETNEQACLAVLKRGGNAAIVFRNKLPETWKGFRVVSGDESDLRFLDPKGCVIGLIAKGKAKQDRSGFVVD